MPVLDSGLNGCPNPPPQLSPGATTTGRATIRPDKNGLGADPMDGTPLLFYMAGTYSSNGNGASSVADVNGDGYPDLVIATTRPYRDSASSP